MNTLKASEILHPQTELNFALHSVSSVYGDMHSHDFMEIFLIKSGEIVHCINGEEEILSGGDMVFIRAEDAHCYKRRKKKDCELINLAFSSSIAGSVIMFFSGELNFGTLLSSKNPPKVRILPADTANLAERLSIAGGLLHDNPVLAKMLFKILISEMISYYKFEAKEERGEEMPGWLDGLLKELGKKENFRAGLKSLRRLASRSDEHVSRTFRKFFGKTPTDYINGLRMAYAASALTGTDGKIDFISSDAGFENLSHFYHLFKKQYGMSPRKFRLMNKKSAIPVS